MSKPIKDYTLGEVKEICSKISDSTADCDSCPFCVWCYGLSCAPAEWNIPEPQRWTNEEIERAKMLIELIPEARRIERGATVIHVRGESGGGYYCAIGADRFPSAMIGEVVTLEEIINHRERREPNGQT